MSNVAYRSPVVGIFQTLLGGALPVSERWADLLEPWQPRVEKPRAEAEFQPPSLEAGRELVGGVSAPEQSDAPVVSSLEQAKFLSDGTEILSDALPDPVEIGQQYAAGGSSGRPPRRGGGPPEGPVGRLISQFYQAKLRTLAGLEPNHKLLTTIQAPEWRPRQSDIDKIDFEIIKARQRVPGAIDSQASGIGIGPYAREAIPARSGTRDWTPEEREEINRLGYSYGCHTCGDRDPGTASGYFVLDHQTATRLNRPGDRQFLFPQCITCMYRQGGLISNAVRRKKP